MNYSRATIIGLSLLLLSSGVSADSRFSLGLNGGGTFPQGAFSAYSDEGPSFSIRGNYFPVSLRGLSPQFTVSGYHFRTDRFDGTYNYLGNILLGEWSTTQSAVALHLGMQLSAGSDHAFFRPRLSLSPSVYFFTVSTDFDPDILDSSLSVDSDTDTRVGYMAEAGADFFVSKSVGISFDFVYDHVANLHYTETRDRDGNVQKFGRPARFHSFRLGIVVQLNTGDDSP